MMTIAEYKAKGSIAEKADRAYAECTQAEGQTGIRETLFDMVRLGNSAVLNGNKTTSAQFREAISIALFIRGAVEDAI